jgi:hypothetical protein
MPTITVQSRVPAAVHNSSKLMLKKAFSKLLFLVPALFALFAGGCSTTGTVAPANVPHDIVLTEGFREYLSKNPKPSLVLIVPKPVLRQVSKSQTNLENLMRELEAMQQAHNREERSFWFPNRQANTHRMLQEQLLQRIALQRQMVTSDTTVEMSKQDAIKWKFYELIEKELMKAGFPIRERSFLNKVSPKNDFIDYAQIGKQVQADLLIEITDLDFSLPFWQATYTDEENKVRTFQEARFNTPFNRFNAKIIVIEKEKGELGGMLTLNHGSEGGAIEAKSEDFRFFGRDTDWQPYLTWNSPSLEKSASVFATELVKILRIK